MTALRHTPTTNAHKRLMGAMREVALSEPGVPLDDVIGLLATLIGNITALGVGSGDMPDDIIQCVFLNMGSGFQAGIESLAAEPL